MPRLKTLLLFCLWFGIADSAASDVTPPQIDSWALQATPLRAEESLVTADDVLKNFSGLGSIQTAPINNRKQQGFLSSSLISDYKIKLQQDVVNQRLVSYLGITAVNLMSDLEEAVGFGESEDWIAARGSTTTGSQICLDGGGYDISVTRSDFTRLSGSITAVNCQFEGLTINGTVRFEYEDNHWYQDTPLQNYPLRMNFANAQIQDGLNRKVIYTGSASCDWRHNAIADSRTFYVQNLFHHEGRKKKKSLPTYRNSINMAPNSR